MMCCNLDKERQFREIGAIGNQHANCPGRQVDDLYSFGHNFADECQRRINVNIAELAAMDAQQLRQDGTIDMATGNVTVIDRFNVFNHCLGFDMSTGVIGLSDRLVCAYIGVCVWAGSVSLTPGGLIKFKIVSCSKKQNLVQRRATQLCPVLTIT